MFSTTSRSVSPCFLATLMAALSVAVPARADDPAPTPPATDVAPPLESETPAGGASEASRLDAARALEPETSPGQEPAVVSTQAVAAGTSAEPAEDEAPSEAPGEDEFGLRGNVELGFLAVLSHQLQLGSDGTRLDYPSDFAQSNLYLYLRLSADLDIWRQHILTFVYQPIDLETRASVPRDVRIDGLDYPLGTSVRARYGFPFYRFGWAFDVLEARDQELAFGLGLQLRNATIEFEGTDGTRFRARNDVGPVPLLRARGRFALPGSWFFAFDVDGFYAFIPGLNGTDNNVEGAILDASVRLGWRFMAHSDAFLNVRYIGGGAAGQGDATPTSDGFQRNWLHFLAISLGATLDTRP